jgi:hypothetical protein
MDSEEGNLVCKPEWVDYDDPAARFASNIFPALSFSCSQAESTPAHLSLPQQNPLGQTIGQRKELSKR